MPRPTGRGDVLAQIVAIVCAARRLGHHKQRLPEAGRMRLSRRLAMPASRSWGHHCLLFTSMRRLSSGGNYPSGLRSKNLISSNDVVG